MSTAPVTASQFHVDMTKVDPALVNKALKQLKLPGDGDFEVRVNRLLEHQVKTHPDKIAVCEVSSGGCGGPSDTTAFDMCPFCGMGDAPAAAAIPGNPPPGEAPPLPSPKGLVKAKKIKLAVVPKEPVAHAAELVPSSGDISESSLDEAIFRVNVAKAAGATCYWDLGAAIRDIYDRRLYTQRKDAKGKPLYASWNAFVKAELGMSTQHVFNVMDVSKVFARADFEAVGISKLSLIAKLDPAAQKEILERARKGLPKSQVSDEVKRLAGMGHGRAPTGRGDAKKGQDISTRRGPGRPPKAAPPKLEADQLTVVVTKERISVPLYARPKVGAKDEKATRAMRVAQDPHGNFELPNGVVMHLRFVLEAKGLCAKVEFKQPAPAK